MIWIRWYNELSSVGEAKMFGDILDMPVLIIGWYCKSILKDYEIWRKKVRL